jgi:hypothetical protein
MATWPTSTKAYDFQRFACGSQRVPTSLGTQPSRGNCRFRGVPESATKSEVRGDVSPFLFAPIVKDGIDESLFAVRPRVTGGQLRLKLDGNIVTYSPHVAVFSVVGRRERDKRR